MLTAEGSQMLLAHAVPFPAVRMHHAHALSGTRVVVRHHPLDVTQTCNSVVPSSCMTVSYDLAMLEDVLCTLGSRKAYVDSTTRSTLSWHLQ